MCTDKPVKSGHGHSYMDNECFFFVNPVKAYRNGKVYSAWEICAETREEIRKRMHIGYSVYDNLDEALSILDKMATDKGWMGA